MHVPSDAIAATDPDWGAALLGDKAHSMVFDNAKLRGLVPGFCAGIPFEQGAREIIDWYDADPARQVVDARLRRHARRAGGDLGSRPRLSRPFSPTAAGRYGDGPGDPPSRTECACDCSSPEEPAPRAVPWWPRRWPAATRSAC